VPRIRFLTPLPTGPPRTRVCLGVYPARLRGAKRTLCCVSACPATSSAWSPNTSPRLALLRLPAGEHGELVRSGCVSTSTASSIDSADGGTTRCRRRLTNRTALHPPDEAILSKISHWKSLRPKGSRLPGLPFPISAFLKSRQARRAQAADGWKDPRARLPSLESIDRAMSLRATKRPVPPVGWPTDHEEAVKVLRASPMQAKALLVQHRTGRRPNARSWPMAGFCAHHARGAIPVSSPLGSSPMERTGRQR